MITDQFAIAAVIGGDHRVSGCQDFGQRVGNPLSMIADARHQHADVNLCHHAFDIAAPPGQDDPRIIGVAGVFHSWRGFGQGMDDVPEVGWILAQDAWGQGLAREAMHAVLDWFDATHGPTRIACMIDRDNAPSLRLADRLGFVRYGEHLLDGRTVVLLQRGA